MGVAESLMWLALDFLSSARATCGLGWPRDCGGLYHRFWLFWQVRRKKFRGSEVVSEILLICNLIGHGWSFRWASNEYALTSYNRGFSAKMSKAFSFANCISLQKNKGVPITTAKQNCQALPVCLKFGPRDRSCYFRMCSWRPGDGIQGKYFQWTCGHALSLSQKLGSEYCGFCRAGYLLYWSSLLDVVTKGSKRLAAVKPDSQMPKTLKYPTNLGPGLVEV